MSDPIKDMLAKPRQLADDCTDFGQELAIICEQYAIHEGKNVVQFVLSMPALVSTVISRCTKKEPGAVTIAANDICKLIKEFCAIDEAERRKELH